MKILYVITGLGQGGAERVVCDLADKMYKKGHEVKIAYLTGETLTLPNSKEIELIKVNLNNLGSLLPAYIRLAKLVKQYKPDVVHSHMIHANLLTRLVRLMTAIKKLISTAHSSNEGSWIRMFLYRVTHHLADITTNVSKDATLSFEDRGAVPKNGMRAVYNGIDLNNFYRHTNARIDLNKDLGISNEVKILLAVGRFNKEKDYPNLLQAIQILKKQNSFSFKLLVAGDGELRSLLEQKINELSIDDEVVLLGRRSDIPELMSAADLFVLSSKYEGFSLVVAEAMACKCLVVATDCGGVAEVLNAPDFLVLPCDSLALANKIKYTLSMNKDIKSDIIHKNIERVHNEFSLDSIVDKWIDIYNEK